MKRGTRFLTKVGTTMLLALLFFSSTQQRTNAQDVNTNSSARTAESRYTRILVTGDATVQAQPDTAIITVAVVTQNATALAAQQENATRTEQVVRALKAAAGGGAGAEVKTSGYALQPQYTYQPNKPPTIKGYEAHNAVTVTLSDLTRVGATVDAASQAGANNIGNLSFTLRRDREAKTQALTEATRDAMAKAQAIVAAINGRMVRVAEVRESSVAPPVRPLYNMAQLRAGVADSAAATPVEVGSLDIRSQVTLIVEVEARQ